MKTVRRILCVGIFFIGIAVFANPVADFSMSVKQGCVPLTINYTDRSSNAVSYLWDFGNGNQSTLKNPSAIYYRSGNFRVTLTVTDANGATSTKVFSPIRVFSNPVASFKADTLACIGQPLSFTDLSIKADTIINKWTWDFGDGNLASSQNPNHAYTYSGKFSIGLTITDAFGCKSLLNKSNYIRVKPSPKADFSLDQVYACKLPGVFKAKNTGSGSTSINWFCSDGSSGNGNQFNTSIGSFGKFTITQIANNNGCSDTLVKLVNIEKPVARFNPSSNTICVGSPVLFQNLSTPDNKDLSYSWDFGDGGSDSVKNPKHAYSATGKYTVTLTVSLKGDCKSTATMQITVHPSPDVEIAVEDSIGCKPPFKAKFSIIGSGYTGSIWDFGDGSGNSYYTNGTPIEHTYTERGSFPLKVIVTNSYGCSQTIEPDFKIRINTQSVEISPDPLEGCIPITGEYKAEESLSEAVVSYEWRFTDSSAKYYQKTVNKTFYKPGDFLAILKVTTIGGCVIYDTAKISVGKKYVPTFKITKYHICNNDTIHFINTTPDSIKNKVTFKLALAESGKVKIDSAGIERDSILKAYRGGKYYVKIMAKHFGCETESEMKDSVYSHGPFLKMKIESLNCKHNLVSVKPTYSWATKVELKKDDTLLDHTKKVIITSYKNNLFKLKAWNDTFSCVDSIFGPDPPIGKSYNPEVDFGLDQNCSPAKGSFIHNGSIKEFKWMFSDGDTIKTKRATHVFKTAGKYTVKLVGHFDSTLCSDTTVLHINVDGVKQRSAVISNGKCLPLQLELQDSAVGEDKHYHTWIIDGVTFEAKSVKENYTIHSAPAKKDYIEVVHKVQTDNGCISEKVFQVPISGPVGTYTMQRFAICDTPVFYFKAFMDSSMTKFPVVYQWQMSSGFNSNQQNCKSTFSTMGMHYYTLSITDKVGCKTIYKDSFEVSPNMLQPLFKSDPLGRFCPPLECNFSDMSKTFSSEIVKWEWDFGDGSTSELRNPKKLYLLPGNYDITLKITSRSGCTAVLKKPGYIIVNGPRGSYDFDRGNACLPHTVQFRGVTLDSASMEWDLGDGVVRQGNGFNHTYTRRGRYIPALILSDTLGCKYTLPPIDTIEVFDYPELKIFAEGLCLKQPIKVRNTNISNHENSTVFMQWFLNGTEKSPGADSLFMPESRGIQNIRLIGENKGTCKDTADLDIRIFAPKSDFMAAEPHICLGQKLPFVNLSTSDTGILDYQWYFGDGNGSVETKPSHTYSKAGMYDITLISRDKLNCADTLIKPFHAVVGDTVLPQIVPIRRASVLDNRTVELVFAKYPDFDFRAYSIYRENSGRYEKLAEIKNRMDTVWTDPQCHTLKNSYCYKIQTRNLCLLNTDIQLSQQHCTIETDAEGREEANFVSWSPYIGFDSIASYEIWRQDYNIPEAYEKIGSVNGITNTYTDSLIQCYTRKNYRIKAIQFGGFSEYSNSDTASAKPYYFNKTKSNYAWRTSVENNEHTIVEWLDNAYSKWGIKGYLLNKSVAGSDKVFSNKYFNKSDTVFTDDFVKVNEKSYIYTVRGIDNCNDTTPLSNIAQSILLKGYFDLQTRKPALDWNHYQKWDQEIDHYEVEKKLTDGSFVLIARLNPNTSHFVDISAESNCVTDYTYRVRAVSKLHSAYNESAISLSNEASVFPNSTLFVPNAFSPDNNDINELFGPKGEYISKYHIQIYNRWGELVFESDECMKAWDGRFMGEVCMQDVYLYRIEALGADRKHYNLKGTFTLLR